MSLLLLDLDVIEIILSYMSTQDRWQLCTICRAAHAAILPRLLSKVDIGLSGSTERRMNQIAQFCRFMLADVPHRIPHLRSLTLGPAFAPPYVAAPLRPIYDHYWFAVSLGHVVALATGLLKISIPQAYWAFEHVPRLLYALISLPDLDHVELYDVNVLHLPLLSKMKSRPRHLAFEERDARFHAVQLLPRGLEFHGRRQLFSELAGSLNILETSLSSESVNELDVVMPLVHTLKISGRIESLAPYSRTFPGVRTLYVHASLGDSLVVTNSTWPQLDFVRTHSPLQLWHCPIRRLELVYFYHNPRGDTLRSATRTMLPKTSSVVLTMLSDYGLFKSLPPDALRCLQFLQLCVSESALIATSLQDEIYRHVSSLSGAPLVGIACVTQAKRLQGESLATHATFIAATIPTLQYVGFDVWEETTPRRVLLGERRPYAWFRVSRAGNSEDAPKLDVLSQRDAEQIETQLLNTLRA